jgi:hypothetical protein
MRQNEQDMIFNIMRRSCDGMRAQADLLAS